MSFAYTNVEDARQHLQHSVVMYDGRPCWVAEIIAVVGDFIATLQYIPLTRPSFNVSIFDPLFNPRGIRLGYTNTINGVAVFLSRVPAKQYKQGLCRHNVYIPEDRIRGNRPTSFENLCRMVSWSDALRGIYPTYAEAVTMLNADTQPQSVAFNRNYAVELDELGFIRLLYKGEPCAFGEDGVFRLPQQFNYLKEELTEMGLQIYGS